MKAVVDVDLCIGCELCVSLCPAVFGPDGEGKVKVIVDRVPAEAKESCLGAQKDCPVEAIKVSE
jgi:ferredoxin